MKKHYRTIKGQKNLGLVSEKEHEKIRTLDSRIDEYRKTIEMAHDKIAQLESEKSKWLDEWFVKQKKIKQKKIKQKEGPSVVIHHKTRVLSLISTKATHKLI